MCGSQMSIVLKAMPCTAMSQMGSWSIEAHLVIAHGILALQLLRSVGLCSFTELF